MYNPGSKECYSQVTFTVTEVKYPLVASLSNKMNELQCLQSKLRSRHTQVNYREEDWWYSIKSDTLTTDFLTHVSSVNCS